MDLPEGYHQEVIEARENSSQASTFESRVSTSPLNSGGASFRTHVLVKISNSKFVYKPFYGVAVFCFLFLAIGLGLLFFNLFYLIQTSNGSINLVTIIVGAVFTIVSSIMFYSFYKPRVFDKQIGIYYKSYKKVSYNNHFPESENFVFINNISALQIIGEYVKSDNGSYKSFELNLVLNDGSRRNIIDHGNLKSIIDDAHQLSDFLNIPIWHAKSHLS